MIGFMNSPFGWSKKTLTLSNRKMEIGEQLTEVLDERFGQCHVLAQAHDVNTQEPLFVKIRYDIYPRCFNSHKYPVISEATEIPKEHFLHEVDASKLLGRLGHGPKYLDHFMQRQLPGMPLAGFPINFLVMGAVPGENVEDIRDELSYEEAASIKRQLAYILENLRQDGYVLLYQQPQFLRYDRNHDKLYLVDLSSLGFTDPASDNSMPIDEHSPFVKAFGIWPRSSFLPQTVQDDDLELEWDWEEIDSDVFSSSSVEWERSLVCD